jgi:hypothetical protein
MTRTTTAAPTYQAITDPTIKTWHLGSAERQNKAFCGTVLIWPADTRKVAVKVAREDRHHEHSDDLTKVTCGACKRNREWGYATGATTRPAPTTGTTTRRTRQSAAARREPTVTTVTAQAPQPSDAAQVDPAEQVDGSQPRARARKRGQSRADKAAARSRQERENREAAQAAATAALDNIDAALADQPVTAGALAEAGLSDADAAAAADAVNH